MYKSSKLKTTSYLKIKSKECLVTKAHLPSQLFHDNIEKQTDN